MTRGHALLIVMPILREKVIFACAMHSPARVSANARRGLASRSFPCGIARARFAAIRRIVSTASTFLYGEHPGWVNAVR